MSTGVTPYQPFLPYQQRYKFLRSSPLARSSVVAAEDDAQEGDEEVDEGERGSGVDEERSERKNSVGALFDDEDEMDGGFDALKRPIVWG